MNKPHKFKPGQKVKIQNWGDTIFLILETLSAGEKVSETNRLFRGQEVNGNYYFLEIIETTRPWIEKSLFKDPIYNESYYSLYSIPNCKHRRKK